MQLSKRQFFECLFFSLCSLAQGQVSCNRLERKWSIVTRNIWFSSHPAETRYKFVHRDMRQTRRYTTQIPLQEIAVELQGVRFTGILQLLDSQGLPQLEVMLFLIQALPVPEVQVEGSSHFCATWESFNELAESGRLPSYFDGSS